MRDPGHPRLSNAEPVPLDNPRWPWWYPDGYCFRMHQFIPGVFARVKDDWVVLENGIVTLRPGFAWNGADVIPDWRCVRRASSEHDPIYQLIAGGHLPRKPWKQFGDNQFRYTCIEDGCKPILARALWVGVRVGGGATGKHESEE